MSRWRSPRSADVKGGTSPLPKMQRGFSGQPEMSLPLWPGRCPSPPGLTWGPGSKVAAGGIPHKSPEAWTVSEGLIEDPHGPVSCSCWHPGGAVPLPCTMCPGSGRTMVFLVTMWSPPPPSLLHCAAPRPRLARACVCEGGVRGGGWGGHCNLHHELSHGRSCPHQKCAEQSFSAQGGLTPEDHERRH